MNFVLQSQNHHNIMESEPESTPVLLSALLEWCDRVRSDREALQRCKRSLEDASLRRQEMKDGCPFCTLLDEAVSKLYGDYLSAGRSLGWTSFPRALEAIRDDGGNPLRFCVSERKQLQPLTSSQGLARNRLKLNTWEIARLII